VTDKEELEVRTSREVLHTGDPCVRLEWRLPGERRWRRNLLIVQPGQTLTELEAQAAEIAGALARDATA
jgi:hypothetical protein